MIYQAQITTVKDTAKLAAMQTVLKVTSGLVYKLEVDFPPGLAGLAGVAIFDGGFQVWPSTLGQFFTGDGILISYDDIYLKESAPFQFTIETYNLDDTYNHLLTVRVGMVSKEIFMARFLPHLSYKYMEEMFNRLLAQQQQAAAEQEAELEKTPYEVLFGE